MKQHLRGNVENTKFEIKSTFVYLGTLLVLDMPKVPSDSIIWELPKSVFGIFGIKKLIKWRLRTDVTLWTIFTWGDPTNTKNEVLKNFTLYNLNFKGPPGKLKTYGQ